MIIPTSKIATHIIQSVTKAKETRQLSTILVGESSRLKKKVEEQQLIAKQTNTQFNLIHLNKKPLRYEDLIITLKQEVNKPEVTAITIQQPLPAAMQSETLFNFIPLQKEIESHRQKSPYLPPMGLAVLHLLKYCDSKEISPLNLSVPASTIPYISKTYKNKKIVLLGRDMMDAQSIGKTLTAMKLNYIHLFYGTAKSAITNFTKEADVVIIASDKIAIEPEMIKEGAIIINTVPIKNADQPDLLKQISDIAHCSTKLDSTITTLKDAYLFYNLHLAAQHNAQ
ncbi:MAG: tetrahydrofolate dehydrogenase/cyclohydrolase catalytic domain-containing protein [Patescibacteria group bacterium]